MKLTDHQLDQKALQISKKIQTSSLELIETLIEINRRHSYADHNFNNLFNYIVEFLGFSSGQAALYNTIIKSRLAENKKVKSMLNEGEVSLSLLGMVGQHVRKNKEENPIKLINKLKNKPREKAKEFLSTLGSKPVGTPAGKVSATIKISLKNRKRMDQLKKKLGTQSMSDDELMDFLLGNAQGKNEDIKANKTITTKTRNVLLKRAGHRCEYKDKKGRRCECRSNLQVEHIKPRAKGGRHNPENLKILCFAHNQRAGVLEFGPTKMNHYFTAKVSQEKNSKVNRELESESY